MLKLIIVDDEPMVCESMKKMIDWKSLEIDVIAICNNGIDAMDVIVDERPDIVVSDIKMPVMDGIDLLKHAKQIDPKIEFIFITGFAEFEYARSAMKYGVQHYLIKPCSESDIIEAISTVSQDILASRDENNSFGFPSAEIAMQNFLVSRFFGYENLFGSHWNNHSYFDFEKTPYLCIELYPFSPEKGIDFMKEITRFWSQKYPQISLHAVSTYSSAQLFFEDFSDYSSEYFEEILSRQMQTCFGDVRGIIAKSFSNLRMLTESLISYMKTSDTFFFYQDDQQIPVVNSHTQMESYTLAAQQIITCTGLEQERSCSELKHMLSRIDHLYTLQGLISIIVQKIENTYGFGAELTFHPQLYTDVTSLIDAFIHWISTVMEKKKNTSSYKDYIQTAISYLEEHLDDSSLSLKWISENVLFMNVDYVSKQFFKQTGMKFSQYLNKLRIDKAKLLLITSPELTMNEIAETIGCGNNPFYFSQLFKKHTGQTPSAFAKAQRKNG